MMNRGKCSSLCRILLFAAATSPTLAAQGPVPVAGGCSSARVCRDTSVATQLTAICEEIRKAVDGIANNCKQPSGTVLSCTQTIGLPPECSAACNNLSALETELTTELEKCGPLPPPPPPAPSPGLPLTVTDVSPDTPFGTPAGSGSATGGRIQTLVLDPSSQTLYGASTNAGVWKTTNGGRSWSQVSIGIRNPLPSLPSGLGNQELALDSYNPKRLLFVTQADDGRNTPIGNLYVSTDGAATWHPAQLTPGTVGGLCPGKEISSVAFSSGQPFVATPCGLFTNPDAMLADGQWIKLQMLPFAPSGAIIAPNSSGNVLFVCSGSQLYRSRTLGLPAPGTPTWDPAISPPQNFAAKTDICVGLSVVPEPNEFAPDTVAMIYQYSTLNLTPTLTPNLGVSILTFGSSPAGNLAFNGQPTGSGAPNVFTVRRASASPLENRPGFGYDVYAADGGWFYVYVPNGNTAGQAPGWNALQGAGGPLHEDSWSMAFPTSYDPDNFNCAAYTSDDGGVFANSSSTPILLSYGPFPFQIPVGCDPSNGWVAAMSGLHTLASYGMKGVAPPSCAGAADCPMVYLATGDNDVWPIASTGPSSAPLGDALGDSGDVHVDSALPNLVVVTRGVCVFNNGAVSGMKLAQGAGANSPPGPGAPISSVLPIPLTSCFVPITNTPTNYTNEAYGPGAPFLTQVMALKNETPAGPRYFAALSPPGTSDVFVTSSANPPSTSNWGPGEAASAVGFFSQNTHGRVARIQSTGGTTNPVIWAESTTGKLYSGAVAAASGTVVSWLNASGTPPKPRKRPLPEYPPQYVDNAASFFVNPYNPKLAWVLDLTSQTIMATTDGGKTWNPDPKLTKVATNSAEFRVGCSTGFERMFSWSCSLAWMSFSRNSPNIVVAALYPGGVVYSNDNGQTWALVYSGIPNASQSQAVQPAMDTLPISVWYDDGVASGHASIYVGLHGNGIIRIDGDFDALPKL